MPECRTELRRQFVQTEVSRVCFAVGITGILTAGAGALIDHLLTGWMSVVGMLGVSLFYLALGFWNLRFEVVAAPTTDEVEEWDADFVESEPEIARFAAPPTRQTADERTMHNHSHDQVGAV